MKRISVDFNTLTSEPVGLVKLGRIGTPNGNRLPPLAEGERILLWEEGLAVDAIVSFDGASNYWVATPDTSTWRQLPLASDIGTEIAPLA